MNELEKIGYEKWPEDRQKYYNLGQEAFDKHKKYGCYNISANLYSTPEFQQDDPSSRDGQLRWSWWYENWLRGYQDAAEEYFRVDEFYEKLNALCDEYNMQQEENGWSVKD